MDHRSLENLFAVVAPGLEPVCAAELRDLALDGVTVVPGGVEFTGRLADLYRVNLWVRTASRVVVRLGGFRCRDFPELYQRAVRLPWGRFLRPQTRLKFRVTTRASRLMHTARVAETLQAAVERAIGSRPDGAPPDPAEQLVLVRIDNDELTVSIDSSGELLHRRGYRRSVTPAPLRETLAAGCLLLLGWNAAEPLADPMCGTGSFLLEAAQLAAARAPGQERDFAFMQWPGYRAGLWQALCREALSAQQGGVPALSGSDCDPLAVAAARENLERSGCSGLVRFSVGALADQPVRAGKGLVICNPPYGRRLLTEQPLEAFYAGLGQDLARVYPGWRKALLCPDPHLAEAAGLPARPLARLDNGGLRVGLHVVEPG